MPPQTETAIVGGRTLRFAELGDRAATRALVLFHAFPVGVRLFEPQRAAFPGWRVIAPAVPGFDGSDLVDQHTVDAYARHALALLDALRIERAVFGGVSMGGYVLFAVLRQAPTRVAGLVLADTRSGADTDAARAGRRRMLQITRDGGPPAVATDMLPKLLGETTRRTKPDLVGEVRAMIEAQSAAAISAAVEVLESRPDSTPLLKDIAVPALVVVGDEDTLTPPSEAQRMASGIAGSRLVHIEGAGHLASLENPAAFNPEARTFLDSISMRT
jgi:pimeloyl-ACP methyl ester carboxylesterase